MDALQQFQSAVYRNDAARLRELLESDPGLRAQIDAPVFHFDCPAIVNAAGRGRDLVDVLLEFGANLNARSSWWAGSFGVLDGCPPPMAAYLIGRGAILDVNAASRLGMLDKVGELVDADPSLVHHRGGDGQTPLHVAATVEIASYLLDHGADIDALDVDHESTPAQYLIRDHPEVVRYLIGRGCRTDILMAVKLGDIDLVRRHLDADPECIRMRVDGESFPMRNPRAGGSIYIWTIGNHHSPHQIAVHSGHPKILELLIERSPADVMLVERCRSGNAEAARALVAANPGVVEALSVAGRRQIVGAAEANNLAAVRLMLELGWPVDGSGEATPLHFAAWHGNVEMLRAILAHHPPLEQEDPEYHAPPIGWAMHGSENSWNCRTGNYRGTVEALLAAGAKFPGSIGGSQAVREALERHAATSGPSTSGPSTSGPSASGPST